MTRSTTFRALNDGLRGAALLAALAALVACGDSPTAPRYMDPNEVARVMPAVVDARVRLTVGVLDGSMRQRFRTDLLKLESAMAQNNVPQARISVDNIGDALTDYRGRLGALAQDAADLTAMELMLYAVAPVVSNTSWDIRFRASSQ
jgi:hypothetical protein